MHSLFPAFFVPFFSVLAAIILLILKASPVTTSILIGRWSGVAAFGAALAPLDGLIRLLRIDQPGFSRESAPEDKTWRLRGGLWVERDLRGEGLVSTTIGMLLAVAEIATGFGAPLRRAGDAHRTMLSGTALSILLIAMTPLWAACSRFYCCSGSSAS